MITNCICVAYVRSKSTIEQRLKMVQHQLEKQQHTILMYEKEAACRTGKEYSYYSSDFKVLFFIIQAFVSGHQQKLRDELEYQRHMLHLDATDHALVERFFDLKPNKSQV